MAKLTATQEGFLKALFGPANGKLKEAAKLSLGSEDYSSILTDDLLEAIKKRADNELILNVPKAVFILSKMLDEPESMVFLEKLHKVAADVLDRAGISKQERPQSASIQVGIVMLPTKMMLPEAPEQEAITLESTPLPLGL